MAQRLLRPQQILRRCRRSEWEALKHFFDFSCEIHRSNAKCITAHSVNKTAKHVKRAIIKDNDNADNHFMPHAPP